MAIIDNLPRIRIVQKDYSLLKHTGGGLYYNNKEKTKPNIIISNDFKNEKFLKVLFHEIGHHYLNGKDETTLQYDNYIKNNDKIEKQANDFADLMLTLIDTAFKLVSLAKEE